MTTNDIMRGMLAALFLAAAVAKIILRADIDDLVLAIFFLSALMISEALKDLDNIRSALARMQVENSKHELDTKKTLEIFRRKLEEKPDKEYLQELIEKYLKEELKNGQSNDNL
jgi:hypothetical protein